MRVEFEIQISPVTHEIEWNYIGDNRVESKTVLLNQIYSILDFIRGVVYGSILFRFFEQQVMRVPQFFVTFCMLLKAVDVSAHAFNKNLMVFLIPNC